jgi:hypothetical protein
MLVLTFTKQLNLPTSSISQGLRQLGYNELQQSILLKLIY